MQRLFKPNSSVLALFMFLPITPSIAAITVFTPVSYTHLTLPTSDLV